MTPFFMFKALCYGSAAFLLVGAAIHTWLIRRRG